MSRPASYMTGFAPRDFRPAHPELWRGCVGAWAPCLGPTGVTLRDWSGYGNDGTATNITTDTAWAVSGGNYCLDLDGTNDHIVCGSESLFDFTTQMAVSIWTRIDSGWGAGIWTAVITKGDTSWRITKQLANNVMDFITSGPTNTDLLYSYTPSGTWDHWAFTYDGANKRIFLNGKNVASAACTGSITLNNYNVSVGENLQATGRYLNGAVDDIRLYNRALSANEIRTLATRRGIAYEPATRRAKAPQTFNPAWARGSNILINPGSL